ncbi:MAG: hypothetical protein ACM3JD_19035 [Rudaea sp.]
MKQPIRNKLLNGITTCLAASLILIPGYFMNEYPAFAPAQPNSGGFCPASPNVLTWSTATEVNTAGFNLYRGDSSDGPFVKVNVEMIPASQNALTGGRYQFGDTDVVPGQTYYYQLEDVEYSGQTTRHGPIEIKALSSNWLCDNPAAAVGIVLGGVAVLGGGVIYARRNARREQALAPR